MNQVQLLHIIIESWVMQQEKWDHLRIMLIQMARRDGIVFGTVTIPDSSSLRTRGSVEAVVTTKRFSLEPSTSLGAWEVSTPSVVHV